MKKEDKKLIELKKLPMLWFIDKGFLRLDSLHSYFHIPANYIEINLSTNGPGIGSLNIKGTHWIDIDHIDYETKILFKLPSKNEIFALCCARSRSLINTNDNLHYLYESLKIKVNVYENILEVMKRDCSNVTAQNISLSISLFTFLKSLKLINNIQRFFLFSRFFYEKQDVMPSFYTYSYTSFFNKLKSFDKLGLDTFFHGNKVNYR